jgi:hypothetical protein
LKKIFRWQFDDFLTVHGTKQIAQFFKITAKLRRLALMMAAFGIFISCNVTGLLRCFRGTNHIYYFGQNPKKMPFS